MFYIFLLFCFVKMHTMHIVADKSNSVLLCVDIVMSVDCCHANETRLSDCIVSFADAFHIGHFITVSVYIDGKHYIDDVFIFCLWRLKWQANWIALILNGNANQVEFAYTKIAIATTIESQQQRLNQDPRGHSIVNHKIVNYIKMHSIGNSILPIDISVSF